MQALEKWLARVLLLNGGLALAVSLGLLGEAPPSGDMLLHGVALLGFLAGVLSLRRSRFGLWGGALYYSVQLISYFPHGDGPTFSVKAGVSLGMVMQFAAATIVINIFALILLIATAAVLWRRHQQPAAVQ